MRFKQLTVIFVSVVVLPLSAFSATKPANPNTLSGAESHTYKMIGDTALGLHVYNAHPNVSEAMSAIVFFFGGGLMRGNIIHLEGQAKALSKLRMGAVLADYRVKL